MYAIANVTVNGGLKETYELHGVFIVNKHEPWNFNDHGI